MSDIEHLTSHLRQAQVEFATAVASIRPDLHRYCARMTGSALDGEDLVQETLAQGLYRLALTRDEVSLRPWLFTLAHHKCVDFLRSRRALPADLEDERNAPAVEIEKEIEERNLASRAFSDLVLGLPPRERAAFILKEVLGSSLPEIAEILETSVGGVKSALHRAREKIATSAGDPPRKQPAPSKELLAYVDAFNRRDWSGLQALLRDEVELELVGHVHHKGHSALEKTYIVNYSKLPYTWKLVVGDVDGEPALVCMREKDGEWAAQHAVRLEWRDGRVSRIRDYVHATGILAEARVQISVPPSSPIERINP